MPNPIITIPEEAKGAMKLSPKHNMALHRKIEGQKIISKICNEVVREKVFGDRGIPTFRERLLIWSSFSAINKAQAADKWLENIRAHSRN